MRTKALLNLSQGKQKNVSLLLKHLSSFFFFFFFFSQEPALLLIVNLILKNVFFFLFYFVGTAGPASNRPLWLRLEREREREREVKEEEGGERRERGGRWPGVWAMMGGGNGF